MLPDLAIPECDEDLERRVRARIDAKTKPPGSLGRIEDLAVAVALSQAREDPVADPARLILAAGDHGIAAEGVSAWPQSVTGQMVSTFLSGGAAANVFARAVGAEVSVVDAGIASPVSAPGLLSAGIRAGTRNALHEDALTPGEVSEALAYGAGLAQRFAAEGCRTFLLGEMGIANTSAAVLLASAVAGLPVDDLTGPGAGLDEAGVDRKLDVLERAAARHPETLEPLDALAAYGGLEIAVLTGVIVGAAARDRTVIVDGFIAGAAAMTAIAARPAAARACVFAHRSAEPGHALVLDWLGAVPLLDLGLRLGEGTGALLALPLVRAACRMLDEMATFESAGVAQRAEA